MTKSQLTTEQKARLWDKISKEIEVCFDSTKFDAKHIGGFALGLYDQTIPNGELIDFIADDDTFKAHYKNNAQSYILGFLSK